MCGVFAPQEMAQIHQLRMRFLGVVEMGRLSNGCFFLPSAVGTIP
jgi:hypothetical protein